ncbi:MAG TPA: hypothetical protein VMY05_10410 [Acidobacteriota bacterium]|nr:hypothetical protein [Acidobacteriota bacterium]
MSRQAVIICILVALTGSTPRAGAEIHRYLGTAASDSTDVSDTLPRPDSLTLDTITPADSTSLSDTLTEAQRMLFEFEERYRQRQKEQKTESREQLSCFDTLVQYFASERLNQRDRVAWSFFRDPGDYFKFDPGYFVLDHQTTPMRKTVQPFGLSGSRLDVIHNGLPIRPFEHIPEPDGLIDLNDVPTALDHDVFLLAGPIGMLFGGQQAVATLVTRPARPDGYVPQSAFLVDKGPFAFSYARGRYSKKFTDGREIDMSIGYRKAEGEILSSFDDAYHYYGDVYLPVGGRLAVQAGGQLYDRDGRLAVRPQAGGTLQARDRFDRSLRLGLVWHDSTGTTRYDVGYTHLRQASFLTRSYVATFDQVGHGFYVTRAWMAGGSVFLAEMNGDYLEYEFGPDNSTATRYTGALAATLASTGAPYRYGLRFRQQYLDDFKMLPSATAVLLRESERLFLLMSAGYSQRAPSLHELYLPFLAAGIYGRGPGDYADHGNTELTVEKQLVGSLDLELGRRDNGLGFRVVAGKIFDGIDWQYERRGIQAVFSPINSELDFVTVSGRKAVRIADFLRFHGGAAYHYLVYEKFATRAYSPDFQTFSGMELHLFWPRTRIDLYAYGEVVYTGSYDGYEKQGLGREAVANAKLSFRMGSFRFHYVFQNILGNVYETREDFVNPGRYSYWGFTWDFLN